MTVTMDISPNLRRDSTEQPEKLKRAAIALYDARLVTQGQAAEIAGLSRAEFIDALCRAGVSVIQYDSAEEILAEARMLVPDPPDSPTRRACRESPLDEGIVKKFRRQGFHL